MTNKCENRCPCMAECPLSGALKLIGGKWKIPILCALHQDGPTRYNELKRKIRGITNTMLAGCLRELESDGLVVRTQYPEMPVRVEYRLADPCSSLIPILGELAQWSTRMQDHAIHHRKADVSS